MDSDTLKQIRRNLAVILGDEAGELADAIRSLDALRAEADVRDEKIGFKIREAETMRVPLMLVVGGQEQQSGRVAVRRRHAAQKRDLTVDELAREMLDEVDRKA